MDFFFLEGIPYYYILFTINTGIDSIRAIIDPEMGLFGLAVYTSRERHFLIATNITADNFQKVSQTSMLILITFSLLIKIFIVSVLLGLVYYHIVG